MIIPSIDLMGGQTVQLIGGREKALDAGDPRPIAQRFALAGEVAVIDLDAAIGTGNNAALVESLLALAPCRIGGGIRDADAALRWLDAGAARVILGTAARPEILEKLPRDRVIAAIDCLDGEVVVKGWRERTGRQGTDALREISRYVGGFLVTFVEREGRMQGIDLARVREVIDAAAPVRVTVAGGVTTAEEIAAIDRLGADAQVGMALYTNKLDLADAIAAPLTSDRPDGLFPTVVADDRGIALGLAYSSRDSLRRAVAERRGVYHSRTRGTWLKGESSGATQDLLRIDLDCDRDTIRFTVRQHGAGFCHRNTRTCWGPARGLAALERTLESRRAAAPPASYAHRLFNDPALLTSKLTEEAAELGAALGSGTRDDVRHEAADVLFFTAAALARANVPLAEVEAELDRRALRLSRRPGDSKPPKGTA